MTNTAPDSKTFTVDELFTMNVLWGSFSSDGVWLPNRLLPMNEAEQYRQNLVTNSAFMRRFTLNSQRKIMITQEQLNADKAAVDAATAQLAKDQADFDRAQPHLSVLAEIEAWAISREGEAVGELHSLVAKARALF